MSEGFTDETPNSILSLDQRTGPLDPSEVNNICSYLLFSPSKVLILQIRLQPCVWEQLVFCFYGSFLWTLIFITHRPQSHKCVTRRTNISPTTNISLHLLEWFAKMHDSLCLRMFNFHIKMIWGCTDVNSHVNTLTSRLFPLGGKKVEKVTRLP